MDSRVHAWEERALELDRRGETAEAAKVRGMIEKVRQGHTSRLGHQLISKYQFAQGHYQESRLIEARYALQEILEKDPNMVEARALLTKMDDEIFNPLPDRPFSSMAEELYDKGMKRFRNGEVEEAFDFLSQARQIYRGDPVLDRSYKRAEGLLEEFQQKKRAETLFRQGREFLDEGQVEEAARVLMEAQALDPSLPKVSEYLEEAEKAVQGRRLRQVEQLVLGARSQTKKRNLKKALSMVDEALVLSPDHMEAKRLRQDILIRQDEKDRTKSANAVFRKAVAQARDFLAVGKLEQAREHMQVARSVRPGSPTLEELVKKADRLEKGSTQDARNQADESYRQGLIAYRQGRLLEARELFEKSIRYVPGHTKAAKALARIP